jgi:DNA (cytosine-5)-methyltransferase 1
LGGKCVFSSEWNASARETYYANFGEIPYGDIGQFSAHGANAGSLTVDSIPDHDLLCGGFPCQPFSLAGVSARNSLGRKHGFACETQGTAFFHIAHIIKAKQPRAVVLENVRNFAAHDGGQTLRIAQRVFTNPPDAPDPGLGYHLVEPFFLNASSLVAQRRVRLFLVAFKNRADYDAFRRPQLDGPEIPLSRALDHEAPPEFTISDRLWQGHVTRSARNRAAGKGFVAGEADLNRPANTLVSRYGKDGKECLVPQGEGRNPRKLTPSECRRLMGFPDEYELPSSRAAAYRQFGNAVVVPVIEAVGGSVLSTWLPTSDLPRNRALIRERIMRWGREHYQDFAWRSTSDPWGALLAEVLLTRTRATTVARVWPAMMDCWSTPLALSQATTESVAVIVRPLGLTKRIARLQALAQAVVDGIPTSHSELAQLPGVGDYVSAAYRSLHLNQYDVLLDANIVRWLCRLNGWTYHGESRREERIIEAADRLTPPRAHRRYNYSALDFTMQVCLADKPRCATCALSDLCRYALRQESAAVEDSEPVADTA